MFPFNLSGPQFILFYGAFFAVVLAALYLVACLRGGPKEVACIAAIGLVDRGLLQITDRTVTRSSTAKPELVRRRIEQEVLRYFANPAELLSVMRDPAVIAAAADEYEFELRHHRLIPDEPMQDMRRAFTRLA